jgi:hypothetical protein
MAKTTPTQRTLKWCREQGGFVGIVEHWNAFCRIRQDLFGFVDLVWVSKNDVQFLQVTSDSNVSARVQKIRENKVAQFIRLTHPSVKIRVHGWGLKGDRGKRKVWTLRVVDPFAEEVGAE